MKKMDVYNGENREITVVTDLETVVIPAKSSVIVKMDDDAKFNADDFYIEEKGNWYIKTESCATGADVEIYDAGE